MQIQEAIQLIQSAPFLTQNPQSWADLGCGKGLFTEALAHLLPSNSQIHAVDSNKRALQQLPNSFGTIAIQPHQLDFVSSLLPLQALDGVLMANSLHYVRDKHSFLEKLKKSLKPTAHFLIIEYDHANANPWVPYPIDFVALKSLMGREFHKVGEKASRFGGMMYAAWGTFK